MGNPVLGMYIVDPLHSSLAYYNLKAELSVKDREQLLGELIGSDI
jgi:hypothetical protein